SNKIFSQRGKNWSGNCDPCKTYNWYDKQIVMNVTLDNGKLLLDGVQSKLVNKKNGTTIVDNELIAQGIIFINSGEGGKFKGGWNLVSEGGGHDETKFTALN